ncbi:hypothetical protein SAMN04488526_1589 [Jannaschia helgolandensis]|uniref:Uncharacterized protein n=1 Tax=Jannaschia helgolandensis TaxID=188906 RepID=A0A1H7L4I4_9RHOB|nr:hypothetical protein SAMN04488526_1589 [Jannaschia helgolandensis]
MDQGTAVLCVGTVAVDPVPAAVLGRYGGRHGYSAVTTAITSAPSGLTGPSSVAPSVYSNTPV